MSCVYNLSSRLQCCSDLAWVRILIVQKPFQVSAADVSKPNCDVTLKREQLRCNTTLFESVPSISARPSGTAAAAEMSHSRS